MVGIPGNLHPAEADWEGERPVRVAIPSPQETINFRWIIAEQRSGQ
jgi:hypothetical protein